MRGKIEKKQDILVGEQEELGRGGGGGEWNGINKGKEIWGRGGGGKWD